MHVSCPVIIQTYRLYARIELSEQDQLLIVAREVRDTEKPKLTNGSNSSLSNCQISIARGCSWSGTLELSVPSRHVWLRCYDVKLRFSLQSFESPERRSVQKQRIVKILNHCRGR